MRGEPKYLAFALLVVALMMAASFAAGMQTRSRRSGRLPETVFNDSRRRGSIRFISPMRDPGRSARVFRPPPDGPAVSDPGDSRSTTFTSGCPMNFASSPVPSNSSGSNGKKQSSFTRAAATFGIRP